VEVTVKRNVEVLEHDVVVADMRAVLQPASLRTEESIQLAIPQHLQPTCQSKSIQCRYTLIVQMVHTGLFASRSDLSIPIEFELLLYVSNSSLSRIVSASPQQSDWFTALPAGFVPVEHEAHAVAVQGV
jgi:hypothetical protein